MAGLIPARAGRTRCGLRAAARTWAHPRSRGEDIQLASLAGVRSGSSPLARGGPSRVGRGSLCGGLIPARAGRTTEEGQRRAGWRAHPRSRGEDLPVLTGRELLAGSSPLARGGHEHRLLRGAFPGLIPARAGRTTRSRHRTGCARAHPRSRGEDAVTLGIGVTGAGSSPLARGGRSPPPTPHRVHGLIPARAGRTWASWLASSAGRAHPRSRGEDTFARRRGLVELGSSPLARGGPGQPVDQPAGPGLIPARAGRTP